MRRHAFAALLLFAFIGPRLAPAAEPPPKDAPDAPPDQVLPESAEDLQGKVFLSLNTGGHVAPIQAMRFTPDGHRLITAQGGEVRVWNVADGEHEHVWRLPSGVRCLAVSPDGRTVAAAGVAQLQADGKTRNAPIWLLPLPTAAAGGAGGGGKPPAEPAPEVLRWPGPEAGITTAVTALAFSPDGSRLAWGAGPETHVYDLKAKAVTHSIQPAAAQGRGHVVRLAFSKDGKRLLVGLYGAGGHACRVWDVDPPATSGPKPVEPAAPLFTLGKSEDPWVTWSADNKRFAVLHPGSAFAADKHNVTIHGADGKQQRDFDKKVLDADISGGDGRWWYSTDGLHFLPSGRVIAAVATDAMSAHRLAAAVLLDPQTGKVERLYRGPTQEAGSFTTALSPDGKLLALTGNPGYEVILWNVAAKSEVSRLGMRAPVPRFVGWSKDGQTVAWGVRHKAGQPRAEALTAGLNLATLEPLGADRKGWPALQPSEWNPDKWKISNDKVVDTHKDPKTGKKVTEDRFDAVVLVKPNGQRLETPVRGWLHAWTFYKDGTDRQDRVAIGVYNKVHLYDPKTNKVVRTLSLWSVVEDLSVSPDGKYLLVAAGQQFLHVFRIDGDHSADKPEKILSILASDEDWVVWTSKGYYAATPGGERLIGWSVKRDDSTPLAFYPVQRFRKLFYKPEVIKQLLETGGVKEALKATRTRGVDVEDALPPAVRIKGVADIMVGGKPKLQVTAEATPGAKGQPVESLRLLLDGRAHPDAKPVEVKAGAAATAVWTIDPLPGQHELKVLARCPDISGVSEAHALAAPLPDKDKPLLYRICVGVNDYDQKGLTLGSARQDAEAVFDALEKYCTGKNNRFRAADGVKLVDKKATRDAVLDALKEARQKVRPGDLVVVFFGCHGVVQRGDFYLLTREADTTKESLKGTALSGKDLQDGFADLPCSVLLLMDACHSAAGIPALALKPATDDLTRSMTDDQVAVTVLAAAMGHETAGERPGHGLFTQALLDGLKAGAGVPYDPHDHQLYVHHLYSHVFGEVRRASEGRQNPFLNMPWTVPPLAIRAVSESAGSPK